MKSYPRLVAHISLICTLFCTSLAIPKPSYELTTNVRKCPCTFRITTSLQSPPLDFIIQPLHTKSSQQSERIQQAFSRYSQTLRHAYHKDGLLAYHKIHIPIHTTVRLSLHQHGKVGVSRHIRAHILPDAKQSSSCPVLIPQDPPSESIRSLISSRIIGGARANLDLAKFIALLVTPEDEVEGAYFLCTGSVIDTRIILTAAHCDVTQDTIVFIGESEINDSVTESYYVDSFTVHPEYLPSSPSEQVQYDIAYVTLQSDVPADVPFLKVNTDSAIPPGGSYVRAIGFGVTVEDQPHVDGKVILNQVDMVAQSDVLCALSNQDVDVEFVPEKIVCATGEDGCGICSGDSGGPLLYYDDAGNVMTVGVVSSSVKCGSTRFPGLYVRTSGHLDFLPLANPEDFPEPSNPESSPTQPLPSNSSPDPASPQPSPSDPQEQPPFDGISPQTRNIIIIATVGAVVLLTIIIATLCVVCR